MKLIDKARSLERYGSRSFAEIRDRMLYPMTPLIGPAPYLAALGFEDATRYQFGPLTVFWVKRFDEVYGHDRIAMIVAAPPVRSGRPTHEEVAVATEIFMGREAPNAGFVVQLVRPDDPPNIVKVVQVPHVPIPSKPATHAEA